MAQAYWEQCLGHLQDELPTQQFNTWIRPLKAEPDQQDDNSQTLRLVAPNRFVQDWVAQKFLDRIRELYAEIAGRQCHVVVESGNGHSLGVPPPRPAPIIRSEADVDVREQPAISGEAHNDAGNARRGHRANGTAVKAAPAIEGGLRHESNLNNTFTFESFVEGKSNQLAHAAARQVAENPGGSYNPLFIYGGVGLGKTHLMHAVGNALKQSNPNAKILYLHSERFVADMVKALQLSAINDFKRY